MRPFFYFLFVVRQRISFHAIIKRLHHVFLDLLTTDSRIEIIFSLEMMMLHYVLFWIFDTSFLRFASLPLPSGSVSTRDNRVFNGPLGRSLCLFARTARSLHSQARSLT